jgi:hypothetical protein
LVIAFVVLTVVDSFTSLPEAIPSNVTLTYKSVENTGRSLFSTYSEYYVFDTSGHRYKVTQKTFDSLTSLDRR